MKESLDSLTDVLDVPQTARYVRMSEPWVRKAVHRKTIPFVKLGRAVRFRRVDLDAYLDACRVDARAGVMTAEAR